MSNLSEAVFGGIQAAGILLVLVLSYLMLRLVWIYALRPRASLAAFRGEWAVVTGASSGIGAGFVVELAKRGVNVVLMARSEDKMKELVKSSAGGVQTRIIPFDFDAATEADYLRLERELSDLCVSILVNNAGVNVDFPHDFLDTSVEDEARILNVNIHAALRMTRMLARPMVERKKGLIYFLSSAGGTWLTSPMLSIYGGTKAFLDSFAVALAGELRRSNVTVHSVRPFHVKTAMAKVKKSIVAPMPDVFAAKCLDQTGSSIRLNPHWAHDIVATVVGVLPLSRQLEIVTQSQRATRSRALKKKAAVAKAQ